MTLVAPAPTVDADAARRLTERIRLIATTVADNVEKLRALVEEAREMEAHVALGYPSWTAYLRDLFGDEPLRLARDVRQELVAELSSQGMSTRAIAPILGVDPKTVHNDLVAVGENSTPVSAEIIGLGGQSYPRERRAPAVPDQLKREVTLVNDIRLYLRRIGTSPEVVALSPGAKAHIVAALQNAINELEGTES